MYICRSAAVQIRHRVIFKAKSGVILHPLVEHTRSVWKACEDLSWSLGGWFRWGLGFAGGVPWSLPQDGPPARRASRNQTETSCKKSFGESDGRFLRFAGGPLGALGGPLECPEAQGRSGVSERSSRGSWGWLGPNPKPLLLGGKYVMKIRFCGLGDFR